MRTLIRDVRLVGLPDDAVVERGHVVVEDGRLVRVAPGAAAADDLGAAADVLEGGGRTLLPGLIDAHVHVAGVDVPAGAGEPGAFGVARDALRDAETLGRLVREGITGIRDLGHPHHGIFAVRDAIEAGSLTGPRMALAGRAMAASGGHGAGLTVEVDGADAMRGAVRREAKAGADWIKLMVTGGTATPGEAVTDVQLTLEEARAAVEEAHRRGRRVTAHVSNLAGAVLALDAGVDCLEHGIELDEAVARRMVEAGVWLSSTLRCTEIEGTAPPGSGIDDFIRRKAAAIHRTQAASFRLAHAAGVRIVAATDAGPAYLPLGIDALRGELETLVREGLSAAAALRAATAAPAELFGWHDVGTIAPDMAADLLVVEGDPLADIAVVGRPWLVMARGRLVRDPRRATA